MTTDQKKLLSILAECLFSHPSPEPVSEKIRAEALKHGVLSLISLDFQAIASNIRIISAVALVEPGAFLVARSQRNL